MPIAAAALSADVPSSTAACLAPVHALPLPGWLFTVPGAVLTAVAVLALGLLLRARHLHRRRQLQALRLAVRTGERTRIARELHDSLLQGVQGLLFRLQAVQNLLATSPADAVPALETALRRGDEAIEEAQRAIQALRGFSGAGDQLAEALSALGGERDEHEGAAEYAVVTHGTARPLDPLLQDDVYCIAREAVRNAFRHGRARQVRVELDHAGPSFSLRVQDDGIGIPAAVLARGGRAGHWGLRGMAERAASFGGRVTVHSRHPVAGTVVELTLPAGMLHTVRARLASRITRAMSHGRDRSGVAEAA